jgi:hypothetical protein
MTSDFILCLGSVVSEGYVSARALLAGIEPLAVVTIANLVDAIDLKSRTSGVFDAVAGATFVAFVATNYRAILKFARRCIKSTHSHIVRKWYVYRYLKKNNDFIFRGETWEIYRALDRRYKVKIQDETLGHTRKAGSVLYTERGRLTIELMGSDHDQESTVAFFCTIPTDGDTRMLGIGIGDDSQLTLSTRVYLACGDKLDEDYARAILDEASGRLRSDEPVSPLMQLSTPLVSDVLSNHPLPSRQRSEGLVQRLNRDPPRLSCVHG